MYHRYFDLYFTTATILNWKPLLRFDDLKDVIIHSLEFITSEKRAVVYAFVIMPNHIHLVWQILEPYSLEEVKAALLSFTAHQFKKMLKATRPKELEQYRVNLIDREYQFWERNALSVPVYHDKFYQQKVLYIHRNPCSGHWRLAVTPEAYIYSSAYETPQGNYWNFVALG